MGARVLIIRLSSIGDVVLTTPIPRSLRRARPDLEIHFATRKAFAPVYARNPYIDQLHLLDPADFAGFARKLADIGFDYVLDLQHNARSQRLRRRIGAKSAVFPKRNFSKFLMVAFKQKTGVQHVVERYGETLRLLGADLDEGGLDFFLSDETRAAAAGLLQAGGLRGRGQGGPGFVAVALGATHNTKKWPLENFRELLLQLDRPAVLLGGPAEEDDGAWLVRQCQAEGRSQPLLDLCGQTDLETSAAVAEQADAALTHDTGMMHIAAALQRPVVSLWGNTVPGFGMTPYRAPHRILEVPGLSCRPCSKLGRPRCPQGHFRCMRDLTPERVCTELATY